VENSKGKSVGAIKAGQRLANLMALYAIGGGHESKALRVTSGTGYMIPIPSICSGFLDGGSVCVFKRLLIYDTFMRPTETHKTEIGFKHQEKRQNKTS